MATKQMKKKKNISLDDLALMMGRGFNEVHEKIGAVDRKIDNARTELGGEIKNVRIGLAREIGSAHTELQSEMHELRKDFNNLQTAVDGYAKKADAYFQEMVMLSHKVDRMERWILQIAKKTGVQLEA